jgi:hypothetical protein
MHVNLALDNAYFHFFSLSPAAPEREALRVCLPENADHAALLGGPARVEKPPACGTPTDHERRIVGTGGRERRLARRCLCDLLRGRFLVPVALQSAKHWERSEVRPGQCDGADANVD